MRALTRLFGCDRVDHVYFHGLDPVVADPADITVANARPLVVTIPTKTLTNFFITPPFPKG